jgi:uncharacterized membrane protein
VFLLFLALKKRNTTLNCASLGLTFAVISGSIISFGIDDFLDPPNVTIWIILPSLLAVLIVTAFGILIGTITSLVNRAEQIAAYIVSLTFIFCIVYIFSIGVKSMAVFDICTGSLILSACTPSLIGKLTK